MNDMKMIIDPYQAFEDLKDIINSTIETINEILEETEKIKEIEIREIFSDIQQHKKQYDLFINMSEMFDWWEYLKNDNFNFELLIKAERDLKEKYSDVEIISHSIEERKAKAQKKKPGPKPKKEAGRLSASRMAFLFSTLVTCKAFPMGSKLSMSNFFNFLTDLDPTNARENFQEPDIDFDSEGRKLMIEILKEAIEKLKDKNFKGLEIVQ